MEEFFKNGFNWMVTQFGASMQSVTERIPWGILLIAGIAALFLLYAGYTAAHFVARGRYKKQLAEDIDAFDESKLSRKAIGLDVGSVGIIVVALLFLTGHAGFWAANGAAGFALCALMLVAACAVFKLVHEILYHACRAAVRRAYWELSAEEDEDDSEEDEEEDDEDGTPAPIAPPRPSAAYSPLGGGDDVYVPRPMAEPVTPVAPPVDADALRPGILEEIRKLKEEEAPQAPMTEEEVLENLKEFGEEAYEEEEDGEESLGAILAETLQDADYDYEDMDQNLTAEETEEEAEPASEAAEEAQPAEEKPLEEPVQSAEEAPVESAEPEAPETEQTPQPAEEAEPAEAEAEAPAVVAEVQEPEEETPEETLEEIAEPEEVAEAEEAPQPEPETEPQPEPARTAKQLGDEEILREIERLKNSKPVPPDSKAARRIPADVPEKETVPEPAPEKPARKKAPTSEELIDQARLARQTADNSEESMKTMQQIALLLQKEREKKKRKTPEEQRRMNEALADLLRAIGKKDE